MKIQRTSATYGNRLANPPSLVEQGDMKFLILDGPSDSNIGLYIEVFKQHKITKLVRACTPTYSTEPLLQEGIQVVDIPFADGHAPPSHILSQWLDLVKKTCKSNAAKDEKEIIGVHCIGGLGRAPVLVAIALIERGLSPEKAIALIREKRKNALNNVHLKFLTHYKRRSSKKCTVM
jgi:protein tyrosine phosphatase type 4A